MIRNGGRRRQDVIDLFEAVKDLFLLKPGQNPSLELVQRIRVAFRKFTEVEETCADAFSEEFYSPTKMQGAESLDWLGRMIGADLALNLPVAMALGMSVPTKPLISVGEIFGALDESRKYAEPKGIGAS